MTAESDLQDQIVRYVYDPLGFVKFVFPWGDGELSNEDGPDTWQADVLKKIGRELSRDDLQGAVRLATRSGHGVGKTCLIAWIILWFLSTRPFPALPVTANTREQLLNKTWRELAKWHRLSINSHWFKWTATKFYHVDYPETWFASAIPWSKERSEAFAGTHEEHVLVLFDEASAIDDVIWEVTEGAMTTRSALWIVFGNQTRNTGRFHECFNKFRDRWITYQVDSRDAKKADKAQIAQWAHDYGEDSDFFRVRVLGKEPKAGFLQLIPSGLIDAASKRMYNSDSYRHAPIIIGVDVADFGDNQSVICVRQGLQVVEMTKHSPRSTDAQWTMTFANIVMASITKHKPEAVCVDSTGLGLGVADRLIQMGARMIYKVYAGGSPTNRKQYFNKRTEMWDSIKEWIVDGAIPNDDQLKTDLSGPEYGFSTSGQLRLEKKTDMKKRGLASPDCGDALSFTFAVPVMRRDPIYTDPKPKPYDPWWILNDDITNLEYR